MLSNLVSRTCFLLARKFEFIEHIPENLMSIRSTWNHQELLCQLTSTSFSIFMILTSFIVILYSTHG
jgi:hypothetical protein